MSGNGNSGIFVTGSPSNVIAGNYVGTNAAGTAALANNGDGIVIGTAAANNTIGGTTAGAGNVISGNTGDGVFVTGSGTTGTLIAGNAIGTTAAGTTALGNVGVDVFIDGAGTGTTVGVVGAGNVIAASGQAGVYILNTSGTSLQANYIGTNAAGATGLGNAGDGIAIEVSSANTVVGGVNQLNLDGTVSVLHGNVIANNGTTGIEDGSTLTGLIVQGNFIGTDPTGNIQMGNHVYGVLIQESGGLVGGTTPGAGNLISGNASTQIFIDGHIQATTGNTIEGNTIGTNYTGTVAITDTAANGTGVAIYNANNNTVGGTVAGAGNLISGHVQWGVSISNGSSGNVVAGNLIGTDSTGTFAIPNGGSVNPGTPSGGVDIDSSTNNTIGGTVAAARNIISGNANTGITISGTPPPEIRS